MRALAVALFASGVLAATTPGCSSEEITFPVAKAPPSRHQALRDALVADARQFASRGSTGWLDDLGDAPLFGVAAYARRERGGERLEGDERLRPFDVVTFARSSLRRPVLDADIDADERMFTALGILELLDANRGRLTDGYFAETLALVESFSVNVDAAVRGYLDDLARAAPNSALVRDYGSTVVTGVVALLHAQLALAGVTSADAHRERALALEGLLTRTAFGDLADIGSGRSARAFARSPGEPGLFLLPNVVMMLVEARLFRVTKDETHRITARALFAAIQPLVLSSQPARYAEPEAVAPLAATTRETTTLATQSALALALLSVFEVTGDTRYVDEVDRVLDALEAMRGPYCLSQLDATTCAPACEPGQTCLSAECTAERCTTGLLHHRVDGRLAAPGDARPVFCSGCSFAALYAVGMRRVLAGEGF